MLKKTEEKAWVDKTSSLLFFSAPRRLANELEGEEEV